MRFGAGPRDGGLKPPELACAIEKASVRYPDGVWWVDLAAPTDQAVDCDAVIFTATGS